ncbi:hypothetical protein [Oryzifoliimicrobium ureilyticus]|uniref:hypothetical protein n=1 Tax=Oryzifoliimicrobium ureilyticus TaxID=3113724 RepID=UPI0030764062
MTSDEPQGELFAHAYFFGIVAGSAICPTINAGYLLILPIVLFFSVPAVLLLYAIYRKYAATLHQNLALSSLATTSITFLMAALVEFWLVDFKSHAMLPEPLFLAAFLTAIGCAFFSWRYRVRFPLKA